MFRILIYGFTLVVLVSTTTPNSEGGVEVRLLDNQNAPLMATLDMSKADERVKQFVNDAIEAKMKNIEQTMRSKQFVIETLDAKMKAIEGIMKSQITNFERNLTDQLTDYINKMVVKVDQENGKSSTYIRWGRSDCSGVNTEIVYSVPSPWCQSIIHPILKDGKDYRDPLGYRGISLMSTVAKMFSSILTNRMDSEK
ncbi:unnamed protein product [Mytilus edulis]|uniref:Uncharacterized protein n=1 Tax=Mytilus edulis TaxID=6550 RepID=A0A8S3ULP8_MYTED|nr:unnamed protein product [Mytilus edulis]